MKVYHITEENLCHIAHYNVYENNFFKDCGVIKTSENLFMYLASLTTSSNREIGDKLGLNDCIP